jgi:hypothetical protein
MAGLRHREKFPDDMRVFAAPPKPAPDAVRDGNPDRRCAHGNLFTESCPECGYVHPHDRSAPVPPAEGTNCVGCNKPWIDGCWGGSLPDLSRCPNLSPSGTVAAEPVAWIVLSEHLDDFGNEKSRIWWKDKARADAWCAQRGATAIPLYAAPRVRGDRETLRKLLISAKLLQQNSEGCAANHYGSDCETFGLPGWLADTKKDIEAAEVLLSLPVQPGAGERKPRIVAHTELCLFLLPFLQQGDFTVEALVSAILEDFQIIDRDTLPRQAPHSSDGEGR